MCVCVRLCPLMDWRGCIPTFHPLSGETPTRLLFSKSTFYNLLRPKVDHVEADNLTFSLSCTGFGFTLIRIIQQTHNHKLAHGFLSHLL